MSNKDTKWKRRIWIGPKEKRLTPDQARNRNRIQMQAELESNEDLKKPIQQLVCDVHEEILQEFHPEKVKTTQLRKFKITQKHIEKILFELQRIKHADKRMVSMMARVALSNDRTSRRLLVLTWVLAGLTLVLVGMTFIFLLRP